MKKIKVKNEMEELAAAEAQVLGAADLSSDDDAMSVDDDSDDGGRRRTKPAAGGMAADDDEDSEGALRSLKAPSTD